MVKIEDVTPELIQDWKAKYGPHNLREAIVDGEDEVSYKYIIRVPSRPVMDSMAEHGSKNNIIAANKVLLSNCVLAGDEQALENDGSIYGGLLDEFAKLQRKRAVTVKKL